MHTSHRPSHKPSILLALLCLAVVRRVRPAWVNISLGEASRNEGYSEQRLSRLTTGAIGPFERSVALLTRRGRPPTATPKQRSDNQHALREELLKVAATLLSQSAVRLPQTARALVLGALQRLQRAHQQTAEPEFLYEGI